jgi:hypothetical protein
VPVAGIQGLKLFERERGNITGSVGCAIDRVVVDAHENPITRYVQVGLEVAITHLECARERLHRVFWP